MSSDGTLQLYVMNYTKKCSDENGVRFCGISIASNRPSYQPYISMNYTLSIQHGKDTLLTKRSILAKRFSKNSDGNFDDIEDGYEWDTNGKDTSEQDKKLSEAKSLKISIKISNLVQIPCD